MLSIYNAQKEYLFMAIGVMLNVCYLFFHKVLFLALSIFRMYQLYLISQLHDIKHPPMLKTYSFIYALILTTNKGKTGLTLIMAYMLNLNILTIFVNTKILMSLNRQVCSWKPPNIRQQVRR